VESVAEGREGKEVKRECRPKYSSFKKRKGKKALSMESARALPDHPRERRSSRTKKGGGYGKRGKTRKRSYYEKMLNDTQGKRPATGKITPEGVWYQRRTNKGGGGKPRDSEPKGLKKDECNHTHNEENNKNRGQGSERRSTGTD